MPAVVGVIVAWQLAVVTLIVVNVQGEPLKDPADDPVWVNATVPAGVLAVPAAVSLTKAVQLVDSPIDIEVGVQLTVVVVPRRVIVTMLLVPLLALCAVSDAATV